MSIKSVVCRKAFAFALAGVFGLFLNGAAFADTLTWTGAAGDGKWSTPENWTSDGTHTVPQSGDSVIAKVVGGDGVVTNDIAGLSLPSLTLEIVRTGATTTVYPKMYGEQITLTGGANALTVTQSGTGSGSHRLYNYIPFYLSEGTNVFTCSSGRLHQYGKLTGPGALRVAKSANYYSPSTSNDYTGGTWFEGGRIDFSGNAAGKFCMGDVSKEVVVDGTTYFRLYSGEEIPYPFLMLNQDSRGIGDYLFYLEANHTFSGAIRGDGVNFCFPSSLALTLGGTVSLTGSLRLTPNADNASPQTKLNGRLAVDSLNKGLDTAAPYAGRNMSIYLNAANNAIGTIYVSAQNHYAGAENAFGTNAVIRPGVLDDAHGLFDCRGYNQTIDRFILNPSYPVTGEGAGHVVTSTAVPDVNDGVATLTLAATDDCETDVKFAGKLSLAWAPKVAGKSFSTCASAARTMTMDGAIKVDGGTFTVNGGNSFPNVHTIEVADGATFVWNSSAAKGLVGVKYLKLAAGATLTIADGAAWPFDDDPETNYLKVELHTGSALNLRAGDTLLACKLSVDGQRVDPNTTYGHAEIAEIANGAVQVTDLDPMDPEIRPPLGAFTAASYVGRGLVAHWDAVENVALGQPHDATATVWKDLSGNGNDLTLGTGVWQGGNALYAKGGDKDIAASLPSGESIDYQTIETTFENKRSGANGILLSNGSGKYMILASGCAQWENWNGSTRITFSTTGIHALAYLYGTSYYIDGERFSIESYNDQWGGHGAGFHLGGRQSDGYGGYAFQGNYHAIRLYSGTLSDEEVRWNAAVDAIRYQGANPLEFPVFDNIKQEYGVLYCRGTVASDYGAVIVGDKTAKSVTDWFSCAGTVIRATAPSANYRFTGWTGDTWAIASGTADDVEITVKPTAARFTLMATFTAPTVRWTGAAGDGKWSTANNWQDEKGVARAPVSGDFVYASADTKQTVDNDIVGLELPHLELNYNRTGMPAGASGRQYVYYTGNKIKLTGGLNAFKATVSTKSGASPEGDYQTENSIPFELDDAADGGTNKMWLAMRINQKGNVTGSGFAWWHFTSGYASLSGVDSRTTGAYVTQTAVFDLNKSTGLGDGTYLVDMEMAQNVRLYANVDARLHLTQATTLADTAARWETYDNRSFTSPITGNRLVCYSYNPSRTFTFSDDVEIDGPVHVLADSGKTDVNMKFNGRLACEELGRYDNGVTGCYTLNGTDGAVKKLHVYTKGVVAGAPDCFGSCAVVDFGPCAASVGGLDLAGNDQTIDRFALNSKYLVSDPLDGHVVTSEAPATLGLAATDDCETDARFEGALSLVWKPAAAKAFQTYAACGRVHPMTGALVVSNGTFTVNGANCFPHATVLEVADGATFVWDSSVAGGLGKVTSVKLGRGATLRVTATAAWPFETDADIADARLDIKSDSVLDFRSGDTFVARRFTVDGVQKEPMTTYGHADAAQIPEGVQVQVTIEMATEADPRTWTGGAGDTGIGLAGNWSGTGAPSLYDGSLEPTFASGGSLASVLSGVYMRNISFSGSNDFTLKGENDSAKLFLEGGIAAADRGTDAAYAVRLPVTLRSAQTWAVNGAKTKLTVDGGLAGAYGIAKSGEGALELDVKDGCAWSGSLTSTAGDITLKGEMTSAEGAITYDSTITKLTLSNAKIAKSVIVKTGNNTALYATDGDNAIGGLDLAGNTTISVAKGATLAISGDVQFRQYVYPSGQGVFVFTNVNLVGSHAFQPSANSTIYIDYPGLPISSYFDVKGKIYTRCENAMGLSQPQMVDGGVWDLCGYNQTCGRFSWISTYNADGSFATLKTTQTIRSDAPATLTVYHDNQSGSGSNKGPQVYAGKIVGQVSLVKTGYNFGDVQDLTIASEIASTGSVEVSWGLLSFTNSFTYNSVSLPGGRWPNCTRATAGRQVAKGGDVHYGTLELLNSKALGKKTEVYVAKGGAKVRLGANVNQRVAALYLEDDDGNWVKQQAGTWGSSASRAEHKDKDRFEGTGLLLVGDWGSMLIVR